MNTKTCTRCQSTRTNDGFYASYKSICKECVRQASKTNYYSNHESRKLAHREYASKIGKEIERERQADKRSRLKDTIARQHKTHLLLNKDRIYERNRSLAKTSKYKEKRQERDKRKTSYLTDSVVKRLLAAGTGVKWAEIPQNLIAMKREQIFNQRLTKQLTNLIKEKSNGS